jgi:hypothetical protein
MSTQAEVKSIDTLAFVKAALATFAHETGQALAEVEMQGQRAVDWITVDQAAYWKAEVRRAADNVNKAIKDLEYCRAFKKVGDNQPSCTEEKKALEKARRRLEYAERKAEIVRRWTPSVQQQFRETCVRLVRFREVIEIDCPRAMGRLEQMLRSLDAYTHTVGPRSADAAASSPTGPTMARPIDEPTPTAPPLPSGEGT